MPAATPLNDRQLALLRRICAGHEPVTSAESSLAPTAYALRRRGLVTTVWDDGHWTAHPTVAGHERLRTGHDPQPAAHSDSPHPELPTDLTTPAELAARRSGTPAHPARRGGSRLTGPLHQPHHPTRRPRQTPGPS